MARRVVVALGGNAIQQPGQKGTYEEQSRNVESTAVQLAELVAAGYDVVLSHGNGPQVGNLLIQNEQAQATIAPMPLDVLGAMTQGMIGYMFQQHLQNALFKKGIQRPVVSLVTQVEVNPHDPGFQEPTKPVGPFFTEALAQKVMHERGYVMKPDSGRGWRRVVASPLPCRIVEQQAIQGLLNQGTIVIAAGGGGIPVAQRTAGEFSGVEAVIDKDRAACAMALAVNADMLIFLTDVPNVKLHYGTPQEVSLGTVDLATMEGYANEGHFAAGSMGPKVGSLMEFVRRSGKPAVISSLQQVVAAVQGTAGTRVVAEAAPAANRTA